MNKQEIEKAISILSWEFRTPVASRPIMDAVNIAIECMKQQLTNGWISVSERLPEDICNCIVSRDNLVNAVDKATFIPKSQKFKMYGKTIDSGYGYYELNDVIAWQPLPERYKEVSHEE